MEHTIWSNLDLNIEDWREDFKMFRADDGIDEDFDDDELYDWMENTNAVYLDDERANLDVEVDGEILVIADLGLWDGRHSAYKILESNNIKDILYSECDLAKWYSDGKDIRFKGVHHDGTNNYLYRVIKDDSDIDEFLDKIYNQKPITDSEIEKYTESLYPYVAKVYGWRD